MQTSRFKPSLWSTLSYTCRFCDTMKALLCGCFPLVNRIKDSMSVILFYFILVCCLVAVISFYSSSSCIAPWTLYLTALHSLVPPFLCGTWHIWILFSFQYGILCDICYSAKLIVVSQAARSSTNVPFSRFLLCLHILHFLSMQVLFS